MGVDSMAWPRDSDAENPESSIENQSSGSPTLPRTPEWMPRISEFYGIVISMYFDDHPPPHFHARYAEFKAKIEISSLEVIEGGLPPGRLTKVMKWASLHREELLENWELAEDYLPLKAIEPLS